MWRCDGGQPPEGYNYLASESLASDAGVWDALSCAFASKRGGQLGLSSIAEVGVQVVRIAKPHNKAGRREGAGEEARS